MKLLITLTILTFIISASDVHVRGHFRQDGTYVPPHSRSSPDNYEWNNYGAKQEQNEPLKFRDQDDDGLYNQYDMDDDNDGLFDDYESGY